MLEWEKTISNLLWSQSFINSPLPTILMLSSPIAIIPPRIPEVGHCPKRRNIYMFWNTSFWLAQFVKIMFNFKANTSNKPDQRENLHFLMEYVFCVGNRENKFTKQYETYHWMLMIWTSNFSTVLPNMDQGNPPLPRFQHASASQSTSLLLGNTPW